MLQQITQNHGGKNQRRCARAPVRRHRGPHPPLLWRATPSRRPACIRIQRSDGCRLPVQDIDDGRVVEAYQIEERGDVVMQSADEHTAAATSAEGLHATTYATATRATSGAAGQQGPGREGGPSGGGSTAPHRRGAPVAGGSGLSQRDPKQRRAVGRCVWRFWGAQTSPRACAASLPDTGPDPPPLHLPHPAGRGTHGQVGEADEEGIMSSRCS